MYCGHQKQKEQHSFADKEYIFLATNKTRTNKAKITSRKRTKKSKNSGFQQICTHTLVECKTRVAQLKTITWRNREDKSKIHTATKSLHCLIWILMKVRNGLKRSKMKQILWKSQRIMICSNGFFQTSHGAHSKYS